METSLYEAGAKVLGSKNGSCLIMSVNIHGTVTHSAIITLRKSGIV